MTSLLLWDWLTVTSLLHWDWFIITYLRYTFKCIRKNLPKLTVNLTSIDLRSLGEMLIKSLTICLTGFPSMCTTIINIVSWYICTVCVLIIRPIDCTYRVNEKIRQSGASIYWYWTTWIYRKRIKIIIISIIYYWLYMLEVFSDHEKTKCQNITLISSGRKEFLTSQFTVSTYAKYIFLLVGKILFFFFFFKEMLVDELNSFQIN